MLLLPVIISKLPYQTMEHLKIPINDLRKIIVNMYVAKKL